MDNPILNFMLFFFLGWLFIGDISIRSDLQDIKAAVVHKECVVE